MRFLVLIIIAYFAMRAQAQTGDVRTIFKGMKGDMKAELLVSKSEKLALKQINHLIKKYKGTALEPDLLFRKADLYVRKSKSARYFEMISEGGQTVFLPPRLKKLSSKRELRKAVAIYRKIERRFPHFNKLDQVLFHHAFSEQQLGSPRLAKPLYKRLVSQFPGSIFVPDSLLALGEIDYSAKKFQTALRYYKEVENYPHSQVYPYALYKSAWAYYNLRNTASAMTQLERVVAYSKANEDAPNRLSLRNEALNDLVVFYTERYLPKDALAYFQKHADQDAPFYLLKLQGLYRYHSQFDRMEVVGDDIIEAYPESKERPESLVIMIEGFETQKARPKVIARVKQLHQTCSDEKWAANFSSIVDGGKTAQGVELKKCHQNVRALSIKFAQKWHKLWKKGVKGAKLEHFAEDAYLVYLDVTPISVKQERARFNYAELLFQRKLFLRASEQYGKVALTTKEKKLKHDAPYSALVSLSKTQKHPWKDSAEMLFKKYVSTYQKNNPRGKFLDQVLFEKALIAYEKSKHQEAKPQFLALANRPNKNQIKSQNLYLDILNILKEYKSLKEQAFTWAKVSKGVRKINLTVIYQKAYFKQIQTWEESGKKLEAASEYLKFAKENKNSNLADKAVWNSLNLYLSIEKLHKASLVGLGLDRDFPKSKHALAALKISAKSAEAIGQLDLLAAASSRLGAHENKARAKWYQLAAESYYLSGNHKKAKAYYTKLAKHKAAKETAFEGLYRIEPKNKNYRNELLKIGTPWVWQEKMETEVKSKKMSQAFKTAKTILNSKKASKTQKAQARLVQANILFGEYQRQSVKTSKTERLALVIQLKTGRLEKAQRAYEAVMNYGDIEMSLQALLMLSSMYQDYVKTLRAMPLPKDLTEQDKSFIKAEIEGLTFPLEEKAVDTTAQALTQARKYHAKSGVIPLIENKLNELNMREPTPVRQVGAPELMLPMNGGDV